MTSFQSSELTELPVVENSQLFAQRTVRPQRRGGGAVEGGGGLRTLPPTGAELLSGTLSPPLSLRSPLLDQP